MIARGLFFLSLFFVTNIFAVASQKEVLLIHSYHKGYKWSDDISKVLEDRLAKSGDIILSTVYMDTKKIATPSYFDKLFELYSEQFERRDFDLVVVSDNNALEFAVRYHERLFKNLPVVFLGINNFDKAMLYENNMSSFTTGVVEVVDVKKNIDLILKIHPDLEKLVIINDRSRTGHAMKRDIFQVLPRYKERLEFEYIDNMEIGDLKSKVRNLPPKTAILWVLLFKDKVGNFFTYKESLQQIRAVSSVPIYGLWDFYLGEGIVGGILTSARAQAYAASKIVVEILEGADPREIPVLKKSLNRYMFDYKELELYSIEVPAKIKVYEVINRPFSFYEEYKYLVWFMLFVVLGISAILTLLATNVMRRKRSELALKNQLQFLAVLIDTIPNPINYKNLNGQYIGCNKAFARLLGKTKEEILGKSAFDFFPKELAQEQKQKDAKLLKDESTDNFEMTLHLPDGRSRDMLYNKAVYKNIDGYIGGIVTVMDDITQRNQQQQFLIQQSKLAEIGEMVAAIAHQWNEPLVELSAILQDMEFCYIQGEMNDVKMKDFVRESMMQIQYMSQTHKDFRNFLKPSRKKDIFCAKKALDEVLEIIERQMFYAHIKLSVTCKDEFVQVFGYENEFKQVLLNIINNAKTKLAPIKTDKTITIHVEAKSDHTQINIQDNGGAIPEDIINFIFDPYFTTTKDGTGLGLYIAKIIIEDKMGGKIAVYNYFENAVFNIEVPNKERIE